MRALGWEKQAIVYLPDGDGGWDRVRIASLASLGDD
jgi:hypothetical protein